MNTVRIIGGEWRRRVLRFPDAEGLRPTPDRVRETLFNWLGQDLDGLSCLDLFAGSGALGFEAASRGAAKVVMVEQSPKVAAALDENSRLLDAGGRLQIVRSDAVKFASSLSAAGARFDVLFLDPPYKQGWIERLAPLLPQMLADDGALYVEAEYPVDACGDWQTVRNGRAGQVFINYCEGLNTMALNKRVAIYAGTFDPLTRGHEDLVRRAVNLFDHVIVGIAASRAKRPFFTLEERVDMATEVLAPYKNAEVCSFDGLLMDFLHERGAKVILRGLRAASDFEYEFQMAGMNRNLYPEVETVFLTPSEQYMFISATMVREIAILGGDVSKFVQPAISERLRKKVAEKL